MGEEKTEEKRIEKGQKGRGELAHTCHTSDSAAPSPISTGNDQRPDFEEHACLFAPQRRTRGLVKKPVSHAVSRGTTIHYSTKKHDPSVSGGELQASYRLLVVVPDQSTSV